VQVQRLARGISQKSLAWKFCRTLSPWKTCLNNVSLRFSYPWNLEELLAEKHWEGLFCNKIVTICMSPFVKPPCYADISCSLRSMSGKCTLYLWWICGNTNGDLLNSILNHFNLIYFFFCTAVNNLSKISNYSSKQRCGRRMSHRIWDGLNSRSPMPVCLPELAEIYGVQNGTANRRRIQWHFTLSLISWGIAPQNCQQAASVSDAACWQLKYGIIL
jgi:hypothetical protein